MPILMDFSGTMYAGVFVSVTKEKDTSKEYLRHILLNQIRACNHKFSEMYGELILCLDSKCGYWRSDVFPYYKYGRKQVREASIIDWTTVFQYVREIEQEITENLPYRVLCVDKAEADDIIGTLAYMHPWDANDDVFGDATSSPCLIVSNDKDFRQLHHIPGLKQYFPQKAKIIHEDNPKEYLFEHILQGDAGDGIPNILSDADTFAAENKRQKPLTHKKKVEMFRDGIPPENKLRYEKNKMLIDLTQTPDNLKSAIIEAYNNAPCKRNGMKLYTYLAENNLKMQLEHINDF